MVNAPPARCPIPPVAANVDDEQMTNIVSVAGTAHLSTHGKRVVAESMYAKGKAFLGAAILLRSKNGHEYVVLHLLCHGIEITLKGLQ